MAESNVKPADVETRSLLTAHILERELQRLTVRDFSIERYNGDDKMLGSVKIGGRVVCFDFPPADLELSLNDFSAKHLYALLGARE